MRSDYFVMILMLSMASVLITYYGSYTEKRYVYDTAKNLQRRINKKLRDTIPSCCKALTKECLSCAAGLMVKDFCKRHRGEYGCPKNVTKPKKIVPEIKYSDLDCVGKNVDIYIDIINTALKYDIRIFPRNGFLLGIVRHKGYLPQEKIDADLGILESDFKSIDMQGKFGVYKLQLIKKHLSWSRTWNGIHPKTARKLPSGVNVFIDGKKWRTISLFFDLNDKEVFYPKWTADFNVQGSIKENNRWSKEGASLVINGTNRYSIFSKSSFASVASLDFYHRKISVPIGYKEILKNFYGKNWMRQEKRKKWASEVAKISSEPLDICPMSWENCKELSGNIHDTLFDQLKRFVSIINETEYVIAYGTLLGAIRDKGINPNEVDNDIVVEKTFSPTIELKNKLMQKNLIIFKHDIYRVCDYSQTKRSNDPPWIKYHFMRNLEFIRRNGNILP